ncbi:hypothetical protein Fmac_005882 [Flemingia macrophylla]|uniref:Uncharacterized protein n=1 Tax=Flemingia macrophylla TaxID=520843 RepID=A0ABD1NA80_9FABA
MNNYDLMWLRNDLNVSPPSSYRSPLFFFKLNPNAAEFVPFPLRSLPSGSTSLVDTTRQVDGSFNQNLSPKSLSAPNLNTMDFSALSSSNGQNIAKYAAENAQQSGNPYLSFDKDMLMVKSGPSIPSRGFVDFASTVKNLASQDSGI